MTEVPPKKMSCERPLVTFALLAYNPENYIAEAVEAAFSQTYQPLEIILSDDCSTDRTFQIIQEMSQNYRGPHRVVVRRSSRNRGLAGHINDVVMSAGGQIISWAAGDDIALPERTEIFVEKLMSGEGAIGVHSAVLEVDINGRYLKVRDHIFEENHFTIKNIVNRQLSLVTQSHAFKKEVFDVFGPFREDLTHEGIAVTFREAVLGNIVYIDKPLTKYRIGSGVSTYSGGDIEKRKRLEPLKYATWRYTALRQMLDDYYKVDELCFNGVELDIKKQQKKYENILEINRFGRCGLPPEKWSSLK